MPSLPQLACFGISCTELEHNAAFFRDALGFEPCGEPLDLQGGPYATLLGLPGASLRLQRLRIGCELVELCQVLDQGPGAHPGRPLPADSRSNDLWFQHLCLVVCSLEDALERLRSWRPVTTSAVASGAAERRGWSAISSAPQRLPEWNRQAAGIAAFKFRGPEGHPLELLRFPVDKGEARWHPSSQGSGPVLGIDHSAIGVADTDRSARFYTELLGLQPLSVGENSGPEQDGLDGLEQVRLRISSLRCPPGPGIECLEYRSPTGGRPMPLDLGPQDVGHWQLRFWLTDLDSVAKGASAYGGRLISPGVVDLADQGSLFGAQRALQLADPDGHRLQLLQQPGQG